MNINDLRTIAAILGRAEPIDNDDAETMRQTIIEDFIAVFSGEYGPNKTVKGFNTKQFREEIRLHEPSNHQAQPAL